MNLKNIIEHPKMVSEAVDRLLVILTDEEKEQIKALPEKDLFLLHFSLGKHIRKAFGLNSKNTALLGYQSANDVSMEIIEEFWKTLQRRKAICRILM